MPAVEANGITIHYEEWGAGPPLLLVMGLGGQLTDWPEGLVELLAEHFRVVALDNRDIGLSQEMSGPGLTPGAYFRSLATRRAPNAPYSLSDMAADAVGLLDGLGIESAHVVGASMGGMIAQTMAIEHSARVRSLTSIMSNTGDRRNGRTAPRLLVKLARQPQPTRETAVEQAVATYGLIAGPVWDEAELRRVVEMGVARSFRPEGTLRQLAAIQAGADRTSALGTVTAPTLVVHGLVDRLVLPSGGMATARAVPDSRLLMFPDMGHDLPRARWPEFVDAIQANAARATSGAAN